VRLAQLGPADWSPAALQARAQITEAFHRFGIAWDEAQVAPLLSCFTQDAVYEVAQGQADPLSRLVGRTEMTANLPLIMRSQGDQRRHLISNVLVEELDLEAGTALALGYALVSVAANGLTLGASVIYSGRLRREADGCWRFSSFFIGMDDYAGEKPTAD
jgi:hypothetical protein